MKYTLVPPNEPPRQYTASCEEIGRLLKNSPDGSLSINQRQMSVLPGPLGVDLELRLREMVDARLG
jgi:hypothetical protein